MVKAGICCRASKRRRDLFRRHHRRPDRYAGVGAPLLRIASSPPCFGQPLMRGIRDDDRAIREFDLIAGAAMHHLCGRDHMSRLTVGSQQLVADGDVAHGRPAGRGRERGVERQCLADGGPGRDDPQLATVQPVGQLVQIIEAGGDPGQ